MKKVRKQLPSLNEGGIQSLLPALNYIIGAKSPTPGSTPTGIPFTVSVGITPDLKDTILKGATIIGGSVVASVAIATVGRLIR